MESASPVGGRDWRELLLASALGAAGLVVTAAAFALAAAAPSVAWWIPALAAGALGVSAVGLRVWRTAPLAPLGGVFVLAGLALQRTDGLQVAELVFGAYYLTFLVGWYGLRAGVYREPIARSFRDVLVVAFGLYVTGSIGLSVLFGADLRPILEDWRAYSLLWFFFPIVEVCRRYDRGRHLVVAGLLFMAACAFVRNYVALQQALSSATYAWEIARVRVTANEMTLTAGALLCAGLASRSRRGLTTLLWSLGFAVLTLGVVLTQWRAYYVSLALGLVILGVLLRGAGRRRLALLLALGSVAGTAGVLLIFGDTALLIAYGLLDRLLSIGTATTADISLLNRFQESRAVLQEIWGSPVVGHGIGTSFGFFDIIQGDTWVKSYAHNGYLTLWYKFGIVGLAAMVGLWGWTAYEAVRVARDRSRPDLDQTLGAVAAALLLALVPSYAVSAPFTTADTVFCFFIVAGLAAGLADRRRATVPAP